MFLNISVYKTSLAFNLIHKISNALICEFCLKYTCKFKFCIKLAKRNAVLTWYGWVGWTLEAVWKIDEKK